VLARCIKKNKLIFDDYKKELQFVRYRGGVINAMQVVCITHRIIFLTMKINLFWKIWRKNWRSAVQEEINFMSNIRIISSIENSSENVKEIKKIEDEMNARTMYYFLKQRLKNSITDQGRRHHRHYHDNQRLDCTHTGMLYGTKVNCIYFMHLFPDRKCRSLIYRFGLSC